MKSYLIRPAGALVLALALASCGGGDDDKFTVAGTVTGLQFSGMTLQNNGGPALAVNPAAKAGDPVNFVFPEKIEYGEIYNVTIKDPPHQTCGPSSAAPRSLSDTAGRLSSIDVQIVCELKSYPIGGTISGLTKDNTGLVLANGSNTGSFTPLPAALEANKPFTYALSPVPYGVTYSVVVITQPVGRFCTVANAAGTMGDAEIKNIDVTCVPR